MEIRGPLRKRSLMEIRSNSLANPGRAVRRANRDGYGQRKGEVTVQRKKQLWFPWCPYWRAMRKTWKTKITLGTGEMVAQLHLPVVLARAAVPGVHSGYGTS